MTGVELIEAKAAGPCDPVCIKVASESVELACGVGGPWSGFFGDFGLPAEGALDKLTAWFEGDPSLGLIGRDQGVVVVGSPGASLLPVLWLRTLWLDPRASITLRWQRVSAPCADTGEQLAGRLCALLVDEIECEDGAAALGSWGITSGAQHARARDEEVFDIMGGLIDSWDLRLRRVAFPLEWLSRTRDALARCAERGQTRIALYGAGTHTRALGAVLMEPEIEVVCVIDDDPNRHGKRLWGFEIVSAERAVDLGVEAVVLSANTFEDQLWARSSWMRDAGIEVVRLYGEDL